MVFGKDRAVVVRKELTSDATVGRIDSVDAAQQSAYIRSMCANIRSIFFPRAFARAPPLAVRLLRDATQKGVLDFPALVHVPIEK